MFIAKHIDALVMLLAGIYCTFWGYRTRTPPISRAIHVLRICGPGLSVAGALLLLLNPAASDFPARVWTTYSTEDGVATAKFPGSPTLDTSPRIVNGAAITQITYKYNVPGRDISLILSRSSVLDTNVSDNQIIDEMLAYSSREGFFVVSRQSIQFGEIQGHEFKLYNNEKSATVLVRVAINNANIYRAIASFVSAGEADDEIKRFVESFEIRRRQANEVAPVSIPHR
jgi:hypothetical protein